MRLDLKLMTTKHKTLLSILLITCTLFVSFCLVNLRNQDNLIGKLQNLLINQNSVLVTGINIDLDKVSIKCIESNRMIFENGKKVSNIENEYGGDNFEVFYDDKLIGKSGIFKTNWFHTHDYFFKILKIKNELKFDFKVKGPNQKSCYYTTNKYDSIQNKLTEIFYNLNGMTDQINVQNYNKKGIVVTDEIGKKDTLINLNLYSNGNWKMNYSTNKCSREIKYNLLKIDNVDSLIYIYRSIDNKKVVDHRIAIKK